MNAAAQAHAIPPEHYKRVPLAEVTSAEKTGPLWSHKDRWWVVDENDCVLFYVGPTGRSNSPQCNGERSIAERFMPPNCRVVFLPWAWTTFKISDYA